MNMPRFAAVSFCLVIASVTATLGMHAVAAEMPVCESEDEAACMADRDERVAIYAKGRDAYDNARNSGDFSEALILSRQLASKGDKNGERLLKMVHLQLGWGVHKNFIQAYGWLSEGIAGGGDYLLHWRNLLAEKMTPEQLAEAKKKAGN